MIHLSTSVLYLVKIDRYVLYDVADRYNVIWTPI